MYQRLNKAIENIFSDVEDFGPAITNGNYVLISNGSIITPQTWETSGKHDSTVTLHVRPVPETSEAEMDSTSNPMFTPSHVRGRLILQSPYFYSGSSSLQFLGLYRPFVQMLPMRRWAQILEHSASMHCLLAHPMFLMHPLEMNPHLVLRW